jgi:hypothetical protein
MEQRRVSIPGGVNVGPVGSVMAGPIWAIPRQKRKKSNFQIFFFHNFFFPNMLSLVHICVLL